ncbi:MAG: lyase family protein [Pseudomonadota bacterium]
MIFDNPLYEALLGDAEMAAFFKPEAEIAAMIRVERALARAQAHIGLVPKDAARAIDEGLRDVLIPADELAPGTATAGVPVPALVAALRACLPQDAAHSVHWGATTQDIMDCALLLRLRDGFQVLSARLDALITMLADLAEAHANTQMAGRTRTQIATPISFGLRTAYWLQGLLDQRDRLQAVRSICTRVQFGGASGANSAVASHGPAIIDALARELDLEASPPWHTNRAFAADLTGWCASTAGAAARIAGDVLLLARREIAEVRLAGGGGSSTMPNKSNPVSAEVTVALGRYAATLTTPAALAMHHHEDRDSTAWVLEWLVIPQAMICAGASLRSLRATLDALTPDAAAMDRTLALDGDAALAEAASFALASEMPRAEAQSLVKSAARTAREDGRRLVEILSEQSGRADLADRVADLAAQGTGREIIEQIINRARSGT